MPPTNPPSTAELFSAIPRTFVSEGVYREAAQTWRGMGWRYLFVLLLVASLLMAAGVIRNLRTEIQAELPYFLDTFPPVAISGGELRVVEGEPPIILNLHGEEAIIIDPTGSISSLDDQNAAVLVTAREIQVRWFAGRVLSLPFDEVGDMEVGKEEVRAFVEDALFLFPILLFPFAYLMVLAGSCLWWPLQAFFYAFISTMLLFRGKDQPEFPILLRLTCLALTPAIAVRTLFTIFSITSSWAELFIVLVEVAYVFLAMRTAFGVPAERSDTPMGGG